MRRYKYYVFPLPCNSHCKTKAPFLLKTVIKKCILDFSPCQGTLFNYLYIKDISTIYITFL
nr:MAG TPA: hypothetical protein [Caudoviricetes sp.]